MGFSLRKNCFEVTFILKFVFAFAAALLLLTLLLVVGAVIAGATWLRGDELAYVSYPLINPDIYLIDLAHDLPFDLTHDSAYDVAPAWSPDGKWLAFASDRDGKRNVYVMDAFGGSLRRITDGSQWFSQPRWSADGKRLIFTALNQPPGTLYSVNFDGSSLHPLTDADHPLSGITLDLAYDPGSISHARAPDGSRIAFMTFRNQNWGIYISPNEGRQPARLLVNIGGFTEAPAWSPDGKRMAYIAQSGSTTDLFVVDVDDGGAPRRLTFTRAPDASPAWRP